MQVFASESERLAFLLEAEAGLYPVPLSALGIAEVDDGQTQAKEHPNTAPIPLYLWGQKVEGTQGGQSCRFLDPPFPALSRKSLQKSRWISFRGAVSACREAGLGKNKKSQRAKTRLTQ